MVTYESLINELDYNEKLSLLEADIDNAIRIKFPDYYYSGKKIEIYLKDLNWDELKQSLWDKSLHSKYRISWNIIELTDGISVIGFLFDRG